MKTELKFGVTFITPEDGKRLKHKDGTDLFSSVMLGKYDSIDNYEEVDELWTPDTPDIPVEEPGEDIKIEPDEEGKIDYETAKKLMTALDTMKSRVVDITETNNMLLECLLEMSEVVYNA
ncbi:MAG: hypothetical protein PHC62_10980 [Candidatus Izemoplasmatales bacterium]|nr:hypothetical protein [Candidatus Izemoplasmatales bacterium]